MGLSPLRRPCGIRGKSYKKACESETGIVLPAEAGGLTLKKQYKYGRVLLWKYTKPMQNTDPAENEPKGEAL